MSKIKKLFLLTLSWGLFWVGHIVSICMVGPLTPILYPVYSKLMVESCRISDKHRLNVWQDEEGEL